MRSSNIQEVDNLTSHIEHSAAIVELQDVEMFVFIDNLVFVSVFYKRTSKIPLLF